MPVNALARQVGFKIGPVVLETLIKRYFDRVKDLQATKLRQDELLYDATFNIIKAFLEAATNHTVEEFQSFSNARTPSPPWVHVVRLLVPMSCCDEAARHLITALGGEEVARRVVGGVKWWQVRGVKGVDAQWILAKKDRRDAQRRQKTSDQPKEYSDKSNPEDSPADTGVYKEEMDQMRCILYSHGGGYYFGSVDQERYSIQRHARKINGRVFAVNYRLAPQYPFPCAIQDLLAAYLFLIRPPVGAAHRPVKPAHIIVAGDSAGGGLSLALLQVIRDSGLPLPAGGVLISPWCDLTHSFPSVHTNTSTDILPVYGLALHKPSTLWPPPSNEMTHHVHASLRSRIRQTLRIEDHDPPEQMTVTVPVKSNSKNTSELPIDVGATTQVPPIDPEHNETILLTTESGESLRIDKQVHLYAQNSQLVHPLISPVLSYLGGLPPLLFIASDKEVLRDEIIYTAHRAANPEKYPVKEGTRNICPVLKGIESKYNPTQVHLQVYDDAGHVLPVLFPFTTPAKFCYRAIAAFCKHVTGMTPNGPLSPTLSVSGPMNESSFFQISNIRPDKWNVVTPSDPSCPSTAVSAPQSPRSNSAPATSSLKRSMSTTFSRAASAMLGHGRKRTHSLKSSRFGDSAEAEPPLPNSSEFSISHVNETETSPEERTAGDPIVYSETHEFPSWKDVMIRERVSTRGIIRPLEPENELDAMHVPGDMIGVLSELAIRRYIQGSAKFDKKFAWAYKSIEKDRNRNLERAKKDTRRNLTQLQAFLLQDEKDVGKEPSRKGIKEGLMATSGSWGWAWAIDANERPPPSSIVSRRDTDDARRLARIADKSVIPGDHHLSGNNLWSVVVSFLTAPTTAGKARAGGNTEAQNDGQPSVVNRKSRFSLKPKREIVVGG